MNGLFDYYYSCYFFLCGTLRTRRTPKDQDQLGPLEQSTVSISGEVQVRIIIRRRGEERIYYCCQRDNYLLDTAATVCREIFYFFLLIYARKWPI